MSKQRERRYISQALLEDFPGGNFALNVPLGPIPTELIQLYGEMRAPLVLRPFRRRVDGVAWRPDRYYLMEAKIRDAMEGLGRLQTYRDLALETPDLVGYEGQPISMRLYAPFAVEWIRVAARKAGIELVERMYPWIASYFAERQEYFTARYRAERDEKKRLRELFGID